MTNEIRLGDRVELVYRKRKRTAIVRDFEEIDEGEIVPTLTGWVKIDLEPLDPAYYEPRSDRLVWVPGVSLTKIR